MSVARWCDYGDHAYKGGRPGTIMLGVTKEVNQSRYQSNQEIEQDVREMCPECAANLGLNDEYEAPESPQKRHASLLDQAKKGITQK